MADQHALVREYLDRYYAAQKEYREAQERHAQAEAELKATGAVVNANQFTDAVAARMRIVLPTERPLSAASSRVDVAWDNFQTTLRKAGLVLRDMADALGIRE